MDFNPYHIRRIHTSLEKDRIRGWLAYLEQHPEEKFVSDGNPDMYTVNAEELKRLDTMRLEKMDYKLRVYPSRRLAIDVTRLPSG